MSILDRLGGGRGRNIPANASFRLTQQGTEKLQEFSGDPKSRILVALESGGTSDVDEIAQRSGMSKGKVERLLPALVRGGYVQYVSAGMTED